MPRPTYWYGLDECLPQFSDTLLMFRLKALRPDKYRERGIEVKTTASTAATNAEPQAPR